MASKGLSFGDRTVLVTGASSGIGRATALAFADAGSNVVLVARRAQVLAKVAAEARKLGAQTLVAAADVTDPAAVTACFRRAVRRFGTVDIVVNNAGVLIPARVVDLRTADLQRMLDVNLIGALHVMQEAVKVMRRQGRTKFALVGLTEALRTELVGERINVSLVLPSVIDTPMATRIQEDPASADTWPEVLTLPPSWVVWSIFLAIRFRLAEIGVPPGSALIEKLAALAPGTTDTLLRRATDAARRLQQGRHAARDARPPRLSAPRDRP